MMKQIRTCEIIRPYCGVFADARVNMKFVFKTFVWGPAEMLDLICKDQRSLYRYKSEIEFIYDLWYETREILLRVEIKLILEWTGKMNNII